MYESTSSDDIWEVLELIQPLLTRPDMYHTRKGWEPFMSNAAYPGINSSKKCGEEGYKLCKPTRMPKEEFMKIKQYAISLDWREKTTTCLSVMPSRRKPLKVIDLRLLKQTRSQSRYHFQLACNMWRIYRVVLQCEECDHWRLLYSKRKLSVRDKTEVQSFLNDITYTCGGALQDLALPEKFPCMYVREYSCLDLIEKLYY